MSLEINKQTVLKACKAIRAFSNHAGSYPHELK
jgi:hypothetical protein